MRNFILLIGALGLAACATVRPQDLLAWEGQPVEVLDKQPFFMTLNLQKRFAADGTEIRNYVNGSISSSCSGGVTRYSKYFASEDTDCVTQKRACNNIFYIKNGIVLKYTPVGSGGARCMTDDSVLPMRM